MQYSLTPGVGIDYAGSNPNTPFTRIRPHAGLPLGVTEVAVWRTQLKARMTCIANR